MKFFAFIMSCVILVTSIVPCKDAAALDIKQATVVKAETHQDCNGSIDDCSPLCICNCCAGCSLYYSSPQLPQDISKTSVHYSEFTTPAIHQIYLPIWQPPQL